MITDVVAIEKMDGSISYRRPINAGSMFATVKVEGDRRILTVRATAFEPPVANASPCAIKRFDFDPASLPNGMQFISREERKSNRPDLTEARVVVSGGRPLRDKDTFERLVGGLADALGGAIGATRAAVDAGMRLTIIKSDRPARSSRQSYTLRLESPARFSTWLASRIRGSSSRSTKTPTRRSFRWRLTPWWATCIRSYHNSSNRFAEAEPECDDRYQ